MVKHVMIDEGSNKVKEYQFTELEKQTKAYSKEELARFRQQFQAESIMEKVRGMVTKIMIQKADHSRHAVTPQMVESQVNVVMNKSIDEILNFLAENGVKLPPPPPPPPPPPLLPPAPRATPARPAGSAASGEHKLRQMLQQKLMNETDLRGAALANKVDQIMSFPKPKIFSILQSPIPQPRTSAVAPPRPAPSTTSQKRPYNWIKECNDHWDYLPPPVQEALKVLGYNETFWNKNEQPALSDKAYPDLTPHQQKAIRILGCSPQEWDEETEDITPPQATTTTAVDDKKKTVISPEERAMMLKIKEMVTFKLRAELNLTGDEPAELLKRAVMEILNLPKEGVEEFLKRPLLPKQVQQELFVPPPPTQLNWVWDSKAYWHALPPHIQDAAKVLGYDEFAWNHTEQPEESDMKWRHLSIRQQEAAITLGYTQEAWDEGDKDHYSASSDSASEGEDEDVVGELDSDDESEFDESSEGEYEVAKDGDDSTVDEDEFIAYFIDGEAESDDDEDDNDGAEDLIANFISDDPNVVRELSKKEEVLDDDSVDGTDIPYVSNSILRNDSSDEEDDDEDFYKNFRSEGKQNSEVLTEDETETTEEKERDPEEQKFSHQLETFMSLWSFKI